MSANARARLDAKKHDEANRVPDDITTSASGQFADRTT
jgi:hypothetical protein